MILTKKNLSVFVIKAFFLVFGVFLSFSAAAQQTRSILWGTDTGLYRRDQSGKTEILWSEGKVRKLVPLNQDSAWALLADKGIWVSEDLKTWENRSRGLPEKVLKKYENGKKTLITEIQDIKDLEVDPKNPEIMVCANKNTVYLSRNGGKNWENLGIPNTKSNGIKAVAVTSSPELTVFCSHSVYGVYYITPQGKSGSKWNEISEGIEKIETTDKPDEVSDIITVLDSSGNVAVYASQSFRPRIYEFNRTSKSWNLLWSGGAFFGPVDSLQAGKNSIVFVRNNGIFELELNTGKNAVRYRQDLTETIVSVPGKLNCAAFNLNEKFCLSELWLLTERNSAEGRLPGFNAAFPEAIDKEGLYLPVNHAMNHSTLSPYLKIIENSKLNMVVIDMKDDYGRLRFTPNTSMINLGRVFRPVDIDAFLKTMKELGIYTVARIVVFKDPEAASKDKEKYAVWDGINNKAWEGYYDTRRKKTDKQEETDSVRVTAILPANDPDYEILRTWYDEKWVDPYSEIIWDYNVSVAEELCRRGFDEIQFDYIRFPTDGINLNNARYRWRDNGMDMDSAIESFLKHARSRIIKPISIDIYGFNGWYRTGARTGQEVEMLYQYTDVICPMYYPSHFEQTFLAHNPPEERSYRIYYYGARRAHIIARGRVIIRPWAQAFFLNVSYDRKYYNSYYVRKQIEGVRGAGRGGFTYWNNIGNYKDIP